MKSARIFAIGLFFETWVPRIFWPPGELKRVGHLDIEQRVREFLPELLALAGIVAIGVMIVALCLAEWVLMFWAMAGYAVISHFWAVMSGKKGLAILGSWPYSYIPAMPGASTLTLAFRVAVVGVAAITLILVALLLIGAVIEALGGVARLPTGRWTIFIILLAVHASAGMIECVIRHRKTE